MNKLILRESDSVRAVYEYHPNCGESFGLIEYLFTIKEAKTTQRADVDVTGYFEREASLKLEKVISREKVLPLEFIQASH